MSDNPASLTMFAATVLIILATGIAGDFANRQATQAMLDVQTDQITERCTARRSRQ